MVLSLCVWVCVCGIQIIFLVRFNFWHPSYCIGIVVTSQNDNIRIGMPFDIFHNSFFLIPVYEMEQNKLFELGYKR